jgi:hypothetical protein
MERRVALKSMAAAMGAMVALPSWASGWSAKTLTETGMLSVDQSKTLATLVESIIPKTDTPGAGELGVDNFVQKMVKDCYDQKVQQNFSKGIEAIEAQSSKAFGTGFSDATKAQKLQVLEGIDKSGDVDQKAFLGLVKNLTIQGYMSSEYVMTNLTHYEMVPARYHGCVPVKK